MNVRKLMEELTLVEVNTNDAHREEGTMQILEWVAYSATETIGQIDFKQLNSTMFNEALEQIINCPTGEESDEDEDSSDPYYRGNLLIELNRSAHMKKVISETKSSNSKTRSFF